jgi:hypothetical protein
MSSLHPSGRDPTIAGRLDHLLRRDVLLRCRVADGDGVGVLIVALAQQLLAHERQHQDERDPKSGEFGLGIS